MQTNSLLFFHQLTHNLQLLFCKFSWIDFNFFLSQALDLDSGNMCLGATKSYFSTLLMRIASPYFMGLKQEQTLQALEHCWLDA